MSEKIPEGWKRVKLGEVTVFNYGKSLPEKKRIRGDIPVYSSAGITGWHNEALVNSKGIIVGRKGTIGKVYKSKIPFYPIDTCYYILPDKNYDFDFIYYSLVNLKLDELNEDSAVPGLNRNTAYSQEILLPPLPEQKAIASVLSSLDDKIDLLHRQNQTLEQMAETLFRKWFIEDAKEDWEEVKLGEIIDIVSGYNHKKHELVEKGAILLSMGSIVKEYGFNIKASRQIKLDNIDKKYFCTYGDIFITTRDVTQNAELLGSPGIVPSYFNNIPIILGSNLYKLNINDIVITNTFLYELLKSKVYREYVKANASGTSVLMFKKHDLVNFKFKKPSENYLKKHIKIISDLHKKLDNNYSKICTLENLRDTLLPKLMSGEVRVKC